MLSNIRKKNSIKDIEKISRLKTSSYTITGPLILGGILAGKKEKDMKIFENIGNLLGEAFQIQDDILGLYGNEKKLGKPIGSDIEEGKKTLLINKALEKGSKDEKNFIISKLGKKPAKKDIEKIRDIVKKTSSLDYCKERSHNLIKKSKNIIKKSRFKKEGKDFLLEICDYMMEREF